MIYLMLLIVTTLMLCCMCLPGVPTSAVSGAMSCLVCFIPLILAGAILSTRRLNGSAGKTCQAKFDNVSYVDSALDFTTFAQNSDTLKALFVMQLAFLCPMQCCALCGGGIGSLVLTSK